MATHSKESTLKQNAVEIISAPRTKGPWDDLNRTL